MFGHDFFLSAPRTDCEGIASSPIACLLSIVLPRTFSPFLSTFLAVFPTKHSFSSLPHYYGRNNLFSDFLFSFYLPIRLSASYFRFPIHPFSSARLSRIFWTVSFAIVPLYKYPCVKHAIFPYEKADIRRYPLLVFFNEPIPPEKFFFPFSLASIFLSI